MKRILMLLCFFFLTHIASAQSFLISTEYGNGWVKECYDNEEWLSQKCAYSNHLTYQRYDGAYIPVEQLNLWAGQWTYYILENSTHYDLFRLGEHLAIPKSFANYTFDLNKISLEFTVTPTQLASRSTLQVIGGQNFWYITIPDKAFKTRFLWDNKLPIISNETGAILNQSEYDANGTLLWQNYKYQVVGNDIRLYYNQTARNFGLASSLIKFKFDSWTVGEGGSAWTGNSTKDNTTLNRDTNRIFLQNTVSDYISKWRFDGSSGVTAYDENLTSLNEGTLTNMNTGLDNGSSGWSSSGKYKNAISFDGVDDYVQASNTKIITGMNWTIAVWINTTSPNRHSGGDALYCERAPSGNDIVKLDSLDATSPNSVFVTLRNDGGTLLQVRSTKIINDGIWHFIVGTKQGTAIKLYVDGILENSNTWSGTDTYTNGIQSRVGGDAGDSSSHFLGKEDNVILYNHALTNDEINQTMNNTMVTSGNLTTWYDAGTGNETYQVTINATTPTNTNYTVTANDNDTSALLQQWTAQTGNQTLTFTGTKAQDTKIVVTLIGNSTASPELITVTFGTQAAGAQGTLYERTADISMTVTAGADRALYAFRDANIPITVTANADRQLSAFRNAEIPIAITASADRILTALRDASISMTLTAGAESTYYDIGELFERFADVSFSITDNVIRIPIYVRSAQTTISFTDTAQRTYSALRNVQTAITVSDSSARTYYAYRLASAAISVSDSVQSLYTAAGILYVRYASETITVVDSVMGNFIAGVNYFVSGYVYNVLGAPVPNARIEYVSGNYGFTDATGYYNISVPSGTRDILNRAIGYFNSTDTISVSGNVEHNVTLTEKEPVINNSMAFVGGIMGGLLSCALLFKIIRKRKGSD